MSVLISLVHLTLSKSSTSRLVNRAGPFHKPVMVMKHFFISVHICLHVFTFYWTALPAVLLCCVSMTVMQLFIYNSPAAGMQDILSLVSLFSHWTSANAHRALAVQTNKDVSPVKVPRHDEPKQEMSQWWAKNVTEQRIPLLHNVKEHWCTAFLQSILQNLQTACWVTGCRKHSEKPKCCWSNFSKSRPSKSSQTLRYLHQ